jgi:hypothetical protein
VVLAVRRRPESQPERIVVDEVGIIKARVQELIALEEDLIAAGQALGRVRRFLVDPEEASPVVDELRERLTDLWLRRFDYEGRLRIAALRRRLPDPPAIHVFKDTLSIVELEARLVELQALSSAFRDVARRAEDSARMFRRLLPSEDKHARWVGDAVEVASEWRTAQTEEIQRFAARIDRFADRVEELVAQLIEAHVGAEERIRSAISDDDVQVTVSGLGGRIHGFARVGLDERNERELLPGTAEESEAQMAIVAAREIVQEVRALARKAGATRSTRTPPLQEVSPVETSEDPA